MYEGREWFCTALTFVQTFPQTEPLHRWVHTHNSNDEMPKKSPKTNESNGNNWETSVVTVVTAEKAGEQPAKQK